MGATGPPVYRRVTGPQRTRGYVRGSDSEPEAGDGIDAVVVGAASRDVATADGRGWRLGGAAPYAALTMARLGLRVAALVGVDAVAAGAVELDLLRDAGVDLHLVRLAHAPVFENIEGPGGRGQHPLDGGDAMPPPAAA